MPGALLRSGKLQEFKALGEDGQPVFTAALQLREAIRLKLGREFAHCLAVPQRNEAGDHIDWYAPAEGDVVPWSSATDEERLEAKAQLVEMHEKLRSVAQTQKGEQGRERQIFGRLLEKVIYFPDDTHVYLVEGKPVLTFWGFIDPQGSVEDDPLGRLKARNPVPPPPVTTPVAPVTPAAPIAGAPIPVASKKRFPWWWWLLIPLLLLLLFLLLRGCEPELPGIDLPLTTPVAEEEQPVAEEASSNVESGSSWFGGGGGVDSGATGESPTGDAPVTPPESGETPADESAPVPEAPVETPPEVPEDPATPETPPVEEPTAPEETPAPEEPPQEPAVPSELPADKPLQPGQNQPGSQAPQPGAKPGQPQPSSTEQPPPLKALEIPEDAVKSGKTDFLNGQWKAGGGIQDARTGKPMQLTYDFKDGKGKVRMTSSDGAECVGDVGAAMNNGALAIQNQGQVKCKDGSTYKLPEVQCKPGAGIAAKCSGTYDNNSQFPIFMKQEG